MDCRKFMLLLLTVTLIACQPEKKENKTRIPPNTITWEVDGEKMQFSNIGGSYGETERGKRLVLFATDGKEGLVLTLSGPELTYQGRHEATRRRETNIEGKECWLRINKKIGIRDVSYISKYCDKADGYIEITEFDQQSNVVSGKFAGNLCPVGINNQDLPAKKIENGVINKVTIGKLR